MIYRRGPLLSLAGILLLSLLCGCGSQGIASMAAIVPATEGAVSVDGFTALLHRSVDLGPVPASTRVSFLLQMRDPGAAREAADVAAIYNPHSRRFGHFDTARQLQTYGPSAAVVSAVRRFLARHGLQTSWAAGDSWLSVSGSARAIHALFGSHVNRYRAPDGQQFIAGTPDPRVPLTIRHAVVGVSHIDTYRFLHKEDVPKGGLTPADLEAAYDITPLRKAGMDGSGETIVFFEVDGYRQSDLDAFSKRFGLPALHPVLHGPKLSPGGEAPMDLEAAHAVAPRAKLVVYSLDQNQLSNQVNSDAQFVDALARYQRTIATQNRGAIVSNSVGSCASILGRSASNVLKGIYNQADALGEAWFSASGDEGGYDCLDSLEQSGDPPAHRDISVTMPAAAPGVTGVGGTRLSVRTDESWYAEEAWVGPISMSGSGGGVSQYFGRPSWQKAPGVGNRAFDPHGMREVPDVAAIADPATSGTYRIDGSYVNEGGTSQAAPIWAGITALIDEYMQHHGGHKLGFANPALYTLARTKQAYPPFHDITVGGNLVYPATTGYDLATGLGSPDAWNLARDLLTYEHGGK